MTAALALAAAVTFTWLGMVLAISFLEAPLKFQAPGVTLQTGLAIGRLVFRWLNVTEAVLAAALLAAVAAGSAPGRLIAAASAAAAVLVIQVAVVRPRLSRRTGRVLAGESAPRSHAHHAYVGLEVVKVAALIAAGALVLAA